MKAVINRCFGGFCLSKEAYSELGLPWDGYGFAYQDDEKRTAPELVACVVKLGRAASGTCADLRIVEVSDDVEWEIKEHDGLERVEERPSWT